jgi:hypothetical protein
LLLAARGEKSQQRLDDLASASGASSQSIILHAAFKINLAAGGHIYYRAGRKK